MTELETIIRDLENRREFINRGNGDVQDVPDLLCLRAATKLREMGEALGLLKIERHPE